MQAGRCVCRGTGQRVLRASRESWKRVKERGWTRPSAGPLEKEDEPRRSEEGGCPKTRGVNAAGRDRHRQSTRQSDGAREGNAAKEDAEKEGKRGNRE